MLTFLILLQICTSYIYANVNTDTSTKLQDIPEPDGSNDKSIETDDSNEFVLLDHAQYFQDIFSEHLAPLKIQFGHVCENPDQWEQRFEQKDFENNRHRGKVKWGDKNGVYGEQYWDLNH